MSIALMTLAWKTDLPSGRKMVLLALCDNANDQGECYPSIDSIANKCSMGERTVQQHIGDMEAAGILIRGFRKGRSTVYKIDPRNFCTPAESAPPQISHPTPLKSAPPPPQNFPQTPADLAPITIKEPSTEPSQKRQAARGTRLPSTWTLPKSWGEWSLQEQPTWTAEHVRHVAEKFRDHWVAMAGAKGLKADWPATWRNWCRNEKPLVDGKAGGSGAWWLSDATVTAKGAELGLKPLAGESIITFKGRIQQAIDNAGKPVSTQPAQAVTVRSDGPIKASVSPANRAAALGAARALKKPDQQAGA
jgi:hypothetical protein